MSETNQKLRQVLATAARGEGSYASIAQSVLDSVSADQRTPIELPKSVLEVMGKGGLPDFVAYTQEDLLRLIDILAKTVGYSQASAETDTSDEDTDDLPKMMADYRDIYKLRTNEEIRAVDTLDSFRRLSSAQAYALAAALLDLAADRKIPASPMWQTIVDNNGKLGGA